VTLGWKLCKILEVVEVARVGLRCDNGYQFLNNGTISNDGKRHTHESATAQSHNSVTCRKRAMAAADSCWYFVELRSSVVFGRKIFCFCCSASGVVGDVDACT
jgi:hypothetical protein